MSNIRRRVGRMGLVGLVSLLLPPVVGAQQASSIAGLVRDTSGAVLPGVTVEAASPVLIEKVRTAVSDSEGRYTIVDLRPGSYVVTFALPGFTVLKREGIELTVGFTATVNAEMQVGALEETITVSGEAPLVDTQNVRRQLVASAELLSTLPLSGKHPSNLVTLTPGFVGITPPTGQYISQAGTSYHGKAGIKVLVDGLNIENMAGIGNSSYQVNSALVEEMVLSTGGISAESDADGAILNVVPKEGSNSFRGILAGLYSNDGLESDNLNEDLRSRGLTRSNKTRKVWDEAITIGGPVLKDKLWFVGALRSWGFRREIAGISSNLTQHTVFYTPDPSRPGTRWEWNDSGIGRFTYQASKRNKFGVLFDKQTACNCGPQDARFAQEAPGSYRFDPNVLFQVTWSAPVTSRLLLEAAAGATLSHWHGFLMPGVDRTDISIMDTGTGITYGANQTYNNNKLSDRWGQRFAVSYVTGSHNFKVGGTLEQGLRDGYSASKASDPNNESLPISYVFRNAVPVSVVQLAVPYELNDRYRTFGIYAQDQWVLHKLTLNLGLRYDHFRGYVLAQHVPATLWIPERDFAPVNNVPLWDDINPRVGAAYDLFGNGRTALKASIGRYVKKTAANVATANNPITRSVISVTRSWRDANGNFVPECDLGNGALNGECGAWSDQNFGKLNASSARWADDVLSGFGVRPFNWDMATEVQHQLRPGMSINGGYYRNWQGNLTVTANQAVTAADYSPYCITAPVDSRLPGGGRYQICGLYDLNPNKFGQVANVVTQASHYGKATRENNFFNINFEARGARGMRIGGGFDTGRTVLDTCMQIDSPQQLYFNTAPNVVPIPNDGQAPSERPPGTCRQVMPFRGQTQLKLNGSYPLPADFVVSAVLQNVSGPTITAEYAATNAEIAPSLGRPLSGGAGTATVNLITPGTLFEGRTNRVDVRLTKVFNLPRNFRFQANVDVYNTFNSSAVKTITTTFGSRWRLPTIVLDPRIIQFSGALNF